MATRKDRIISINALIKTNLSFLRLLVSFYAKSMDIMTWTLNCYAIAFLSQWSRISKRGDSRIRRWMPFTF